MKAIFLNVSSQDETEDDLGDRRLSCYALLPSVLQMLTRPSAAEVRLGLIVDTRQGETGDDVERALRKAVIYHYFDPKLLICTSAVGHQKDSLEIFKIAVVSAGLSATPGDCLFVGNDVIEQASAMEAGMQVCSMSEFFRLVGSGEFDS